MLATAAASTGLARYALTSGITAGLAALLTAINTFLQKPEERSVFERSLAAKFESLQVKAERIRIVELIDTNAVIAGSLLEEISDEFGWLTRSADRLPNEPEPPRPVRAS